MCSRVCCSLFVICVHWLLVVVYGLSSAAGRILFGVCCALCVVCCVVRWLVCVVWCALCVVRCLVALRFVVSLFCVVALLSCCRVECVVV